MAAKLIVGLGNPGDQYQNTRHNAGFLVLDRLACLAGTDFSKKANLFSLFTRVRLARQDVVLAKPQTFMNESGRAVSALLRWFKISPDNMLVCHDDSSLTLGRIRLQCAGGAGGHHGVESIIEHSGGQKHFDRLKFGVGPDPGGGKRANFVTSAFPVKDRELVEKVVRLSADAALSWLEAGIKESMNKFNGLSLCEKAQIPADDGQTEGN